LGLTSQSSETSHAARTVGSIIVPVIIIIIIITHNTAAQHKIAKYSKLASTHMFYPIAIETAGTWDDMAIELVQEIGRRTTV